jgi:hypothetical protein
MTVKPPPTEKETRNNLIGWARKYGCEADLMKIFNRYDVLLKHAKSQEEYKLIQVMGIKEIEQFFGSKCLSDNSLNSIIKKE